jgi:predicted transcriptional regulator
MDIDCLKFLVRLYECRGHRVYLANWKNISDKDKICEYLEARGLIDFTRQVATVKTAAAGQALLQLKRGDLSIAENELRVLQKIAKSGEIAPSQIAITINGQLLKAKERQLIIDKFCEQGLISVATKKAKDKCEVWLSPKGLDCIRQVNDYFLAWESSPTPQEQAISNDETIL